MAKADLNAARLREILEYEPSSGALRWLKAHSQIKIGDVAGAVTGPGYVSISIAGRRYLAHRLAWLYVVGSWPTGQIDHINGVKTDNRFSNLRDVSAATNLQNNRRARAHSKLGIIGVRCRRAGAYEARISIGGKQAHIGTFATADEAAAAVLHAKRLHQPGCTI